MPDSSQSSSTPSAVPAQAAAAQEQLVESADGAREQLLSKISEWSAWLQTQPLVEQLKSRVTPLTEQSHKYLVESQWFNQVDAIYLTTRSQAVAFVEVVLAQYAQLAEKGRVTSVQFLNAVKQQLGRVWDDALVGPAMSIYALLQQNAVTHAVTDKIGELPSREALLKSLGEQWQTQVVQVLQSSFRPAQAVYSTAVEQFLVLKRKAVEAKEQVLSTDPAEFIANVRTALGKHWNERLQEPLVQFFNVARTAAIEDLQRVQAQIDALEWNQNPVQRLGDYMAVGKTVVSVSVDRAHNFVQNKWNGLLLVSNNTFDYLLPSLDAEEGDESADDAASASASDDKKQSPSAAQTELSLAQLKAKVSDRLSQRAAKGVSGIRSFSSTRLQEIIHIDLIGYAEDVLDNVHQVARNTNYEEVQKRLNSALVNLKGSYDDTRAAITASTLSTTTKVGDNVSELTGQLRKRLQEAIERTRALSGQGRTIVAQLPEDVTALVQQIPDLVQQARGLDAEQVSAQRDVLVAKFFTLLGNVKHVFFYSSLVQMLQPKEPSTGEKAAAAVESAVNDVQAAAEDATDQAVAVAEDAGAAVHEAAAEAEEAVRDNTEMLD